jgi:hypothetical protein
LVGWFEGCMALRVCMVDWMARMAVTRSMRDGYGSRVAETGHEKDKAHIRQKTSCTRQTRLASG